MTRSRNARFLVVLGLASAAFLALAFFISESWLTAFFRHPHRPVDLSLYAEGAVLLRIMLAALGISLFMWALIIVRLAPTATPSRTALAVDSRGVTRVELALLAGAIILGAALRMSRIAESLWYDEVAAWTSFGVRGPGPIVGNFHDPANHILHTLLTWVSVEFTHHSLSTEVSLRLPAFLASLLTIPVVFALARRVAGRETAIAAAALFAIWPVCVLEGAEARGYSLMMLFSGLTTLQLLIARESQQRLHWLIYALWCALGAWSHLVTVFVAIGHGAWLVIALFKRAQRRTATAGLLSLVLAAVMALALFAPVLPEIFERRGLVSAANSSQPTLLDIEGLHMLLQLGGSWLWYASLPMLALLVLGIAVTLRKGEEVKRDAIALSLAGLLIFVVVVVAAGTWVYARFALFALPGAALAAAIGWTWLRKRSSWAAVIAALLACAGSAWELSKRPPKQPLREAAEHVLDHGGEGSRVLLVSIAHPVLDAYLPGVMTSFNLGATLERDLATARPAWVVMLYPDKLSSVTIETLAAHGFTQVARFDGWVDWGEGDVVVFEKSTSQQSNKSTEE